jgi:hypothetical protein
MVEEVVFLEYRVYEVDHPVSPTRASVTMEGV